MKKIITITVIVLLSCGYITPKVESKPKQKYLYWSQSPTTPVFIASNNHKFLPNIISDEEWVKGHAACLAEPGSTYEIDPNAKHPNGIIVTSGNCQGYRGWVEDKTAFHDLPLGRKVDRLP